MIFFRKFVTWLSCNKFDYTTNYCPALAEDSLIGHGGGLHWTIIGFEFLFWWYFVNAYHHLYCLTSLTGMSYVLELFKINCIWYYYFHCFLYHRMMFFFVCTLHCWSFLDCPTQLHSVTSVTSVWPSDFVIWYYIQSWLIEGFWRYFVYFIGE